MEVLSSRVLLRPVDLDRSVRFYGDVLGLHVYREFGEGDQRGVVFFLGGGFLEVSGRASAGDRDHMALWLQVPDVAAEESRLRATGVTITEPARRMPWGLVELWIEDPDGLPIAVIEVPEDHPLRRRV